MKYLPLRELDTVTNALNFSTADCHVFGGCDLYTTKAAGGDKKLYKNIENSLESQYESLVRLSASLSPPYKTPSEDGQVHNTKERRPQSKNRGTKNRHHDDLIPEINLSRASPFGPLSQITARRTFAYLIATLNASHPDYDFSHLLRPTDFHKERSLRAMMQSVDSTLQNLRPRQSTTFLMPPNLSSSAPAIQGPNDVWSPRMWNLIDKEMGLKTCEKYTYVPDEDPFDGDEGAIWSMHYFFFNRQRKRVCYLYIRGLSVISHSPVSAVLHARPRLVERKASSISVGEGAGKRASYWLGNRVLEDGVDSYGEGEDDDDEMIIAEPGDDEDEANPDLDDIRNGLMNGFYAQTYDACDDDDEYDVQPGAWRDVHGPSTPRGMSEEVAEAMEI